ncbi:30S ribosomal protein S8 [Dethiosulfatarculus sandiegensis]|uniref:Small ribosomal subunit protein uS8 n=1 Tax=Dethiosulfatarculus sandiegensis TaxID=1429043 RepID=A0A0D2GMW0_9BACT|nr:30S ribosomal protein S8 [Dethiosulfatarculus sandiegensis]KIX15967.1 30S ribosomal protein S8 [Dethiosulfatarculus sandiegensis]
MAMSDPIADMLTRVRNAFRARHEEVDVPASGLKVNIAKALETEGYITGYEVLPGQKQDTLRIRLKYQKDKSVIEGIERVSKPSRRVYVSHKDIPQVLSGLGVNILSTPKGVMSDRLARQNKVGGEILCAVW